MKRVVLSIFAVAVVAALSPADAWANPQHERMKRCSQEAKQKVLKGDDRKQFMSVCLKGKHDGAQMPAKAAGATEKRVTQTKPAPVAALAQDPASSSGQKDRMKGCNREATEKTLKGDARKAFMAECLKG